VVKVVVVVVVLFFFQRDERSRARALRFVFVWAKFLLSLVLLRRYGRRPKNVKRINVPKEFSSLSLGCVLTFFFSLYKANKFPPLSLLLKVTPPRRQTRLDKKLLSLLFIFSAKK
jgi:hypothetical protein